MTDWTLDDRLQAVADLVPAGGVLADIGADHAYLSCYLVGMGRVSRAVAVDVAVGPLARARAVVQARGLIDRIELRLGDGLSVLRPHEADTLVLAGMGGRLCRDILRRGAKLAATAQRLILQPQRNPELVRQWLADNGWRIIAESLARDGSQWYNIIAAQAGQMQLNAAELAYGPLLRDGPYGVHQLRRPWLLACRHSLLTLEAELAQREEATARQRRQELHSQCELLQRLIDEV